MNESQKEYNRMVYRLTRPYTYVKQKILQLFEGRSYDFRGDSRTPWSNMLDNHEHIHYNERHGLHLNPSKSVGKKGKRINEYV
jgi:hypothetical protein